MADQPSGKRAVVVTPGLPDPRYIAGDWTGEEASREERQALAYRECRARLRRLYVRLSDQRKTWAESDRECAAARAVAYQSAMADVATIIATIETLAGDA